MAAPHPDRSPAAAAGITAEKRALRRWAIAARLSLDADAAGPALARTVLEHCCPPRGAVVAGVWPLPGEIDLRPLLHALAARGTVLALPETPPRGQPLVFRRWAPGGALRPGRFGTWHPDGAVLAPDWLLVPLLAFDSACRRLGFGGGYYDRTLAALPGRVAVGYAFAAQRVDRVPVEPTDQPLDAVATEHGVVRRPILSPEA